MMTASGAGLVVTDRALSATEPLRGEVASGLAGAGESAAGEGSPFSSPHADPISAPANPRAIKTGFQDCLSIPVFSVMQILHARALGSAGARPCHRLASAFT